ncbi:MAG: DMT family transporter [Elusimicrobia bacterium]|nr:DMT family transporter [Elusimicrobiota bacterium]
METRDVSDLVILAALWGGSFLFMRVAAPEFGPLALIELRVLIAALFLAPILIRSRSALRPYLGRMFVLGAVNSALPFALFAYATLSVTAGFAAILNSTAPFFTALVAWVWLKQRLTSRQVVGLLIGFVGVLTLVWDKASFKPGGSGLAILACLAASFLYGLSANYIKTRLPEVKPLDIAAGTQAGAALFLLPFALWAAPAVMPSLKAWLTTAALGVLCTGVAYMLYFRLIASAGPTRAIAVTFLIPVFGMLWGALFLKEAVTLTMAIGTAIILLGTSLTTGLLGRRPPAPA